MRLRLPALFSVFFLSLLPFSLSSPSAPLTQLIRSSICPAALQPDYPTASERVSTTRRHSSAAPRIINGDLAADTLRPYLVSLLIPSIDGISACTGVLVAPRVVLTAAHCEVTLDTRVGVALSRALEPSQPFIPISGGLSNPDFSSSPASRRFDIAFLILEEDAPAGSKFMKVNVNPKFPVENSFVRALGYGVSDAEGNDSPSVRGFLRQVDVPVTSNAACEDAYEVIDSTMQLCAGYSKGGCDSCQGDSGGPLIQYDENDEPVLVGIVSFGKGCAEAGYPGVYVRTSGIAEWLDEHDVQYTKASDIVPVFYSPSISIGTIVGIIIAVLFAIVVTALIIFFARKHRKTDQNATPGQAQSSVQQFTPPSPPFTPGGPLQSPSPAALTYTASNGYPPQTVAPLTNPGAQTTPALYPTLYNSQPADTTNVSPPGVSSIHPMTQSGLPLTQQEQPVPVSIRSSNSLSLEGIPLVPVPLIDRQQAHETSTGLPGTDQNDVPVTSGAPSVGNRL